MLELDVDAFEAAATTALATNDLTALRQAVARYPGPLLPSLAYGEWVLPRREALARLHERVLAALAGIEASIDPTAAEEHLRALLIADPADEVTAQRLMHLLAGLGRRSEALRVYHALVDSLRADLGVAPARETEALHAQILSRTAVAVVGGGSALPSAAPTVLAGGLSTGAHRLPTNLPASLSSFIGRGQEQAEIAHLVRKDRLVTLTGPGGVGKSRLATRVAVAVLPDYPDGVWLVELSALTDPGLIVASVATALDVHIQPHRPLLATLIDYLSSRRLLLVLDTCEHLVAACADLIATLLHACPYLVILTTSREAMGLEGEIVWRVAPLALAPACAEEDVLEEDEVPPSARVLEAEAIQLLLERARAVCPGFTLTDANAGVVASVCRRLDGLPLAIELAAARLSMLLIEQIAAGLDDRFQLLTSGSRLAVPRHQSLRANVDWSYALLGRAERTALRQLSVLEGGWSLDAARAACAGGGIEPGEVLDLLSRLVASSLVQVTIQDGTARYSMLETVRRYAAAQLDEMPAAPHAEAVAMRARHLEFYVGPADEAVRSSSDPEHVRLLNRLEA
jgi:non-specific serine/threonine protein kinase